MVPRGLETRTLRLLAARSNQLSYETKWSNALDSHDIGLKPLTAGTFSSNALIGTRVIFNFQQNIGNTRFANSGRAKLHGLANPNTIQQHHWSSGRIHRCHRCDPGSIPGWCTLMAMHPQFNLDGDTSLSIAFLSFDHWYSIAIFLRTNTLQSSWISIWAYMIHSIHVRRVHLQPQPPSITIYAQCYIWIPFGDHPLKLERYRED
jgi:hypothetical protein